MNSRQWVIVALSVAVVTMGSTIFGCFCGKSGPQTCVPYAPDVCFLTVGDSQLGMYCWHSADGNQHKVGGNLTWRRYLVDTAEDPSGYQTDHDLLWCELTAPCELRPLPGGDSNFYCASGPWLLVTSAMHNRGHC